jgi:molybdate transport system substrate-binding protein
MNARSIVATVAHAAIAVVIGHAIAAHGADVKVLSSNAISSVLEELVPGFERSTGHKVTIVYDTANLVVERVLKRGETADLTIVTPAAIDDLAKQAKLVPATRTVLASSGMGIAVRKGLPKPDISTVEAFKSALLAAKSIAYTGTGGSGIHFAKVIEQLGIAEQIKAKAKIPAGGLIGELLVNGEAEMAVQQIPELMAFKQIDFVGPLPKEYQLTTVMVGAIFAGAKQEAGAQALLKLLAAPSSAAIYKAKGMEPAAKAQ